MGLEPTTFCMAISTWIPDSQQQCGFLGWADAFGLPAITGDSDSHWTVRVEGGSPAERVHQATRAPHHCTLDVASGCCAAQHAAKPDVRRRGVDRLGLARGWP